MSRHRLFSLAAVTAAVACGGSAVAAPPKSKARPAARPAAKTVKRGKSVAKKAPAPKLPVLLSIAAAPSEFTLNGPRAEQRVLVSGQFSDGVRRDLTAHARYVSLAPKAVRINAEGLATPAGDGEGKIKVVVGKFVGWVKVAAKDATREVPASFKNEVIPVLTKAGCNQGACHGAQHGKGGLRLSLLGYDPDSDYTAIVRQNEGRRVVMTDPEQSLMLLKPVLGTPHAGGMRFKKTSYEYQVLLNWLRDGAPGPDPNEPEIASVEVTPAHTVTRLPRAEGDQSVTVQFPQLKGAPQTVKLEPIQRLVAVAKFQDGSTEDATRKTQFNSLNDALASADSDGLVTVQLRGETSVMVRYRGAASIARFTAPYQELKSFPALATANYIDQLTSAKWKEMGLLPSPRSSDAEFIRRVYLDVLGQLPKPEEVKAFLAECEAERQVGAMGQGSGAGSQGPGAGKAQQPIKGQADAATQQRQPEPAADPRGSGNAIRNTHYAAKARQKLIASILSRPEYVDYWTLKWGDLLRNHRNKLGDKGMWAFYNWLRASFRDNKPMDQFARELITAQGSTYTTGPANYYRVARTPADLAETTSQVFLGVRLACAKCHHHPFEKWSQDDYWQFAAFFSRVGLKGSQEFGLFGQEQVVRLNPTGEVSNPRTRKVMKPTPLDGQPADDPIDRRRVLASWLTAPDNMLFARNIVNRYWGYLMGRGIVEPIDDMRVTNPPSNPELLDALAKDFVAHRFDVKHLLKTIMSSETYQLSSQPTRENRQDEIFYSKYAVKRMGAEELLDAVNFATATTDKFPNLPAGIRAVQLPDPDVRNYFLDTFGRPERAITCECERSAEPNMAQALHLMNSSYVQNKIAHKTGRIATLLGAKKPDPEIIEELYLVTYSRPPAADELTKAQEVVHQAPSKQEGFEDLLWALLNSREFMFKH